MLDKYRDRIGELLVRQDEFTPFPNITVRHQWERIPEEKKNDIIRRGESCLAYEWPNLPATRYMDFGLNGNRRRYEKPCFDRRETLWSLVAAECVEDKGRFIDDIINGIWCICEETAWWVPAHMGISPYHADHILPDKMNPVIDLFAAETAALLSWTYYLLKPRLDIISKRICERIEYEVNERVIDPYLNRDDFFWMGGPAKKGRAGNWTTWCTSNCLATVLIMEKEPGRRAAGVLKAMTSIDYFLSSYPGDGGCEEGPSYWRFAGGALFECLELLSIASKGTIDIFNEEKVREIFRCIYKMHISGDYYLSFGDAIAKMRIPPSLISRIGRRIDEPLLLSMGAYLFHRFKDELLGNEYQSRPPYRALSGIFGYRELAEYGRKSISHFCDTWIESLQVMGAREKAGSDMGFYLGMKGGHNGQFHNHNDVGNFYIYYNGQPVFVDVGVGAYTAKHRSAGTERYKIWTQRSSYHNLPTINGYEQLPGAEYAASDVKCRFDDSFAELSMDLAKAYPGSAGIICWKRTCALHRMERPYIQITENFRLEKPSDDIKLSFMTPHEPLTDENGKVVLKLPDGSSIGMEFDADNMSAACEYIPIEDEKLVSSWGSGMYRVVLVAKKAMSEGRFTIRVASLESGH